MWHLTVTHISANLPTASTNNWDSRDLDTETRLVRTLTSSHLSFPSPSWLLASRDIFMTVAPPLCALLSSFLPPFSTCKVCPMSTYYADLGPHMYAVHVRPPHHTSHGTVAADRWDHLPESVPATASNTPCVLFFMFCIIRAELVCSARYKDISSNHLEAIVSYRY